MTMCTCFVTGLIVHITVPTREMVSGQWCLGPLQQWSVMMLASVLFAGKGLLAVQAP